MVRKTLYPAALALAALVGLALPVTAEDAAPKSADDVIALNLAARGGADKIAAMKTMRMSGKMAMGPGMEAPFTIEWKRPNQMRMEFTIQGMTGVQAFDGTTAWMLMPFMGQTAPDRMPEDQAKDLIDQADVEGALVNYKEKGSTVEYLGEADVEGTPTYKLKVTKKSGDVVNMYIDKDSHLELKADSKRKMNGQEMEINISFGDYKEVDGLMIYHSIEAKAAGAPGGQMITTDKIEINIDLAEDRFKMPAAAPAAPPATP